ncbi:MAG: hypothetical protein ACT4PM_03840 [Gemmatimonadales bacterium]
MRTLRIVLMVLAGGSCQEAAAPATPEWRLSESLVRIGTEGVPEAEFHRVAGAVRLPNGEIAVADGGSNQVRYFGPDGTFRRAFGRQGAGPGEFQSMGRPIRFGDTLAVHDGRNDRLTLFRSDTLLLTRPVRASNATERFYLHDRLADGRWLATTGVSPRFSSRPYRDSIAVGIFPAVGEGDVQRLGWFPGPWIVSIEGQITGMAAFFAWVTARPVAKEILVLDSDQERLRRFALDGTELPGGAIPVRGQPLTRELIEQVKRRDADPDVPSRWIDTRYDPAVLPDRLPFRGFLVDSDNLVWLEEYRLEEKPGRYFILSLDARLVATITVPPGFRATEIGSDYVLGVETDANGVERIVVYRLTRT